MQDHAPTITSGQAEAPIEQAPGFDAAAPFIDRHLAKGRGGKVVIGKVIRCARHALRGVAAAPHSLPTSRDDHAPVR